jgi:diguanylate cyclase (GGDEF)-like protein
MDKVSARLYMVDIDNFKQTNDVYGHLAGNQALKKLAEIMESTVRDTDLVCRMGGDEFIILCSNLTEKEAAENLAERLLEKAAANGDNYIQGISIGISPVGTNLAFDTVMKKADKALYHSKRNGKNRFSVIV